MNSYLFMCLFQDDVAQPDENLAMLPVISPAAQREEKPCTCEACKDRR